MHVPVANPQPNENVAFRRDFAGYLAQRMGPMIHALMVVALCAYLLAVVVRGLVGASPTQLLWQLLPAPPLLLVTIAARQCREPLTLRMLALLCVVLLEIGVNLTGFGTTAGTRAPLPGLLLPVASSVIWFGRWDFLIAMALCALGPLPLLLHLGDGSKTLQFAVYMAISVSLATVLRAFMARTLFEQFRLERQLREQANTDGLTGLLQRNRFLELARLALDCIHRQQQPACVLYLDADHFKPLNDDYGHAAGDAALVALAAAMREQLRQNDLIGRIGGEEFAILLHGCDLHIATRLAEDCRVRLAGIDTRDSGFHFTITASFGVSATSLSGYDLAKLLSHADLMLYRAKREGRNRVRTYAPEMPITLRPQTKVPDEGIGPVHAHAGRAPDGSSPA